MKVVRLKIYNLEKVLFLLHIFEMSLTGMVLNQEVSGDFIMLTAINS